MTYLPCRYRSAPEEALKISQCTREGPDNMVLRQVLFLLMNAMDLFSSPTLMPVFLLFQDRKKAISGVEIVKKSKIRE